MGKRSGMENALLGMTIFTWLVGAAIMAIGLVMLINDESFKQVAIIDPTADDPVLWKLAILLMIATGALTFAVGFIGWIGALIEFRILLLVYMILTSICMVAMAVGGSLAVVYKFEIDDPATGEQMQDHLINNYTEVVMNGTYYDAWTEYQTNYQCCGALDPQDWLQNPEFSNGSGTLVPASCCNLAAVENATLQDCYGEVLAMPADPQVLYTTPCYEALQDNMNGQTALVYGLTFGTLALSIISTALAGIMYGRWGRNKIGHD